MSFKTKLRKEILKSSNTLMRKSFFLIIVFTFTFFSKSRAVFSADSAYVAPFGKVYVYKQPDTPLNVVILISGDGGWKFGVVDFAEAFSKMNNLVIGVDILRYYKDLRQRTGDCYNVSADFVQLATVVEKKYNFTDYIPAVIMGYSSGATLVYGILAQSRPGTFKGGISLGFCPDIELPKPLCQINGLTEKADIAGKKYFLLPDAKLGNPWIVLHGKVDKVCNYNEVVDFVNKTGNAELITLPNTGHGFSKWNDFMPEWKDAFNRLIEKHSEDQSANVRTDYVKKIPIVITNTEIQNKDAPIALIISGDGGWYGFEQSIADKLANHGIPTIGLDSKKYFWKRRTPEGTANDIINVLNYYSREWKRERFLLIGYSLGAEIVPFITSRLPGEMKTKVTLTVLLSPETNTDFEIHLSNMLGIGNRQNTFQVMDEIVKTQIVPTLIIIGDGEKTQVPELLAGTAVKIKKIPGDHHYKNNTALIVQTMKDYKAF
jgi:type IV secretory pathway VirJ component